MITKPNSLNQKDWSMLRCTIVKFSVKVPTQQAVQCHVVPGWKGNSYAAGVVVGQKRENERQTAAIQKTIALTSTTTADIKFYVRSRRMTELSNRHRGVVVLNGDLVHYPTCPQFCRTFSLILDLASSRTLHRGTCPLRLWEASKFSLATQYITCSLVEASVHYHVCPGLMCQSKIFCCFCHMTGLTLDQRTCFMLCAKCCTMVMVMGRH
jgi:hypothetical protein